jgi:hypothetical protein
MSFNGPAMISLQLHSMLFFYDISNIPKSVIAISGLISITNLQPINIKPYLTSSL